VEKDWTTAWLLSYDERYCMEDPAKRQHTYMTSTKPPIEPIVFWHGKIARKNQCQLQSQNQGRSITRIFVFSFDKGQDDWNFVQTYLAGNIVPRRVFGESTNPLCRVSSTARHSLIKIKVPPGFISRLFVKWRKRGNRCSASRLARQHPALCRATQWASTWERQNNDDA